jgi:hypothetical protein
MTLIVASFMSMIAVMPLDACMVLRHIDIPIPPVAYEIDGVTAGIVSVAVPAPVFRMTGRDAHVDRLSDDDRRRPNHDRSRVQDLRLWKASDVYAAIKARLADADGQAHIGGICRGGDQSDHDSE